MPFRSLNLFDPGGEITVMRVDYFTNYAGRFLSVAAWTSAGYHRVGDHGHGVEGSRRGIRHGDEHVQIHRRWPVHVPPRPRQGWRPGLDDPGASHGQGSLECGRGR